MTRRAAAVVLAAGRGTRFHASGGTAPSKLVAPFRSKPVVRHAVEAALGSVASPVIVVTGHAQAAVEAALAGCPVKLVPNPDYADGLASSLKAGIAAVPDDTKGVLVLLGDMPMVTAALIDRLLAEAHAAPDADAVIPSVEGRRGNPVYLSRRLFPRVALLQGDAGARHLLRGDDVQVREVPVDGAAAALDLDEQADFAATIIRASGV